MECDILLMYGDIDLFLQASRKDKNIQHQDIKYIALLIYNWGLDFIWLEILLRFLTANCWLQSSANLVIDTAFADIWSLKLRIICRPLLSLTCVSLQEREVIFNDINSMLIRTSHKIEPTVANFWALNSWLLKEHWLKEQSLFFQLIKKKYLFGVYFQLTSPP